MPLGPRSSDEPLERGFRFRPGHAVQIKLSLDRVVPLAKPLEQFKIQAPHVTFDKPIGFGEIDLAIARHKLAELNQRLRFIIDELQVARGQ